ncbi:aspartic peptidase domain-containing protein [Zopfochytrium polystomum]|nr:aspartic peptidase domain-containing protein [Zopfochytrium polystomum]
MRRRRGLQLDLPPLLLLLLLLLLLYSMTPLPPVEALRASGARHPDAHNVNFADPVGSSAGKAASFVKMEMNQRTSPALRTRTMSMLEPEEDVAAAVAGLQRRAGTEVLTSFTTVATEFYASMSVGTPQQSFRVLFDTGSYWTWVKANTCATASCASSSLFAGAKSSTFTNTKQAGPAIAYVDGTNVTGTVVSDTVVLDTVAMPGFKFVSASSVVSFNPTGDHDYDGIAGMGLVPTTLPANTPTPLFQQLTASGVVAAAQIGYTLFPGDASGEITFGGYDTDQFYNPAASLAWAAVTDGPSSFYKLNGMWTVPLLSISSSSSAVSGASYPAASNPIAVLVDTGDSFSVLPSAVVSQLAAVLGCQYSAVYGINLCPCSLSDSAATLPTLTFKLGTAANPVTLTVTAAEYIVVPPAALGIQNCLLAMSPTLDSAMTFTLGNTVLKRYYSVFDYGARRIGFTLAKGRTALAGEATAPPAATSTASSAGGGGGGGAATSASASASSAVGTSGGATTSATAIAPQSTAATVSSSASASASGGGGAASTAARGAGAGAAATIVAVAVAALCAFVVSAA